MDLDSLKDIANIGGVTFIAALLVKLITNDLSHFADNSAKVEVNMKLMLDKMDQMIDILGKKK